MKPPPSSMIAMHWPRAVEAGREVVELGDLERGQRLGRVGRREDRRPRRPPLSTGSAAWPRAGCSGRAPPRRSAPGRAARGPARCERNVPPGCSNRSSVTPNADSKSDDLAREHHPTLRRAATRRRSGCWPGRSPRPSSGRPGRPRAPPRSRRGGRATAARRPRVASASRPDVDALSSFARTFTVTVIISIAFAGPTAFAANCDWSSLPATGTSCGFEAAMTSLQVGTDEMCGSIGSEGASPCPQGHRV